MERSYQRQIEPFGFQSEFDETGLELFAELADQEWEEEFGRRRRFPIRRAIRKSKRPRRPPIRPKRRPRQPGWSPVANHEPSSTAIVPKPEGSEYVRWVQTMLNQALNLQLPVDGVMNVQTRSAIRSFQEKNGLPVTGIVGPDTERALLAAAASNSTAPIKPSPSADEPTAMQPVTGDDAKGSDSELSELWQSEFDQAGDTFTVLAAGTSAPFKDWVWPMPVWNGRKPVISNEFNPRPGNEAGMTHPGVDILYIRRPNEPAKLPEGTKGFFVPSDLIPVYAVASGVVIQSGKSGRGHSVIIDHGNGYTTFYQHLTAQGLPAKSSRVTAGTPIGIVGHDTAQGGYPLNHLHFEIWPGRDRRRAIDPYRILTGPIHRADVTPTSPSGSATTPGSFFDAVRRGVWSGVIRQSIQSGERDENRLTDMVFNALHPELQGRRLRADERSLVQEWVDIRNRLVRPALGVSPAGRSPTAPAAPSKFSPAEPPWVRTLVPLLEKHRSEIPLDFLLGWIEVESGGRIGTVTKSLNERGYFQNHPDESKKLGLNHDRLSRDPDYSVQGGIALVRDGAKLAQMLGFKYGSDLSWAYSKLRHWLPLGVKVIVDDMKRRGVKPATWGDFRTYVLRDQQRLAKAIKNEYIRIRHLTRSWELPPKWHPAYGIDVVDRVFKRGRELAAGLVNPGSAPFQLESSQFALPSFEESEVEWVDGVELESPSGSCPDTPVPPKGRPRVLVRGSKHSAVREAQRKLNAFHAYRLAAGLPGLRDAPLAEDCDFGNHTYTAVKSFQELVFPGMPIEHDGKIGSNTWTQLDAIAIGPGPSPSAQLTVEQLRIVDDGFTGALSWDQVIGLDTASLNVELVASGLPPAVMPAQIMVEFSSRAPNRAGGTATLGTPLRVGAARFRPDPASPNRIVYRLSRPLANLGEFLKVERQIKEVTTIVRSGGTSDAEFRRVLGWNSRGIATQPATVGASTGSESGEIPDASALFRSAGVEVLDLRVPAQPNWRVPGSVKRLVRSPADVVYYSGHGLSRSGKLALDKDRKPCGETGTYLDWLGPSDLTPVWTGPMDLDVLILAGCSVLKIDFSTPSPSGTGMEWSRLLRAKGGPLTALLGYRKGAPCDNPNGDRIAQQMAQRMARGATNFARDWLEVNGNNNANNAVAMDDRGYWWIEGTLFGRYDIKGPEPIP